MIKGPVFWHQGLFLQPQHFQVADARLEELLGSLASMARPWFWGVRELSLDLGALAAGTVALTSCRVLFPGMGILLECPGNAVCAGRVPPEELAGMGESVDVLLGLRLLKPGQANVSVCDGADELSKASTRLAALTGQPPVDDLYQEGPAAHTRRLTYVLQLVFGPEAEKRSDMLLMPVARLTRAAEAWRVDQDYAPPCFCLEDSPLLTAIVREVRDRVLGKARELDSYKNLARRGNMGDMTSLFLILRSLSRFAARLDAVSALPRVAPWDAYILLRELVAELSVFSSGINPLGEDAQGASLVPPYEHTDPAPAFRCLRDLLIRLLDSLSTGPRYMVRFEPKPPVFEARLAAHIFEEPAGRNEYWVTLHSATAGLDAHGDAVRRAKFSSAGEMPTLLSRALPGLPFSVEEHPPLGLARKKNTLYLRLHTDSPLWLPVTEQGGLALCWEEAPADLEAYFVVLEN
ncbi:type VI secretion system baseplate subunit TssK [Desulfovibrio sp. ZJ200]|uniref:type VI secretion system baseplate subunit TssK n=1 Tax=Desulfovibrio sp. ZJ200 TaxID=2709792 RepID=UPI0013EABB7D|nr:type VI secretion system baseplate subunit TssK [Desulfovibrio sp. ZJ200]